MLEGGVTIITIGAHNGGRSLFIKNKYLPWHVIFKTVIRNLDFETLK